MTRYDLDNDVAEQAEYWFVQLESGDVTEQDLVDFQIWLSETPAHQKAYDRVGALCREIDSLQHLAALETDRTQMPLNGIDMEILSGRERPGITETGKGQGRPRPRWRYRVAVVFAALAILFGVAETWPLFFAGNITQYATNIAEIKDVELADGTHVTLGARSEISVRYGKDERQVTLSGGEAFFTVAADKTRPFIVNAGDTVVRVVGTKFNIHTYPEQITIAVLEGEVEVFKPKASFLNFAEDNKSDLHVLTAGQQVVSVRKGAVQKVSPKKGRELASWRVGQLIYDNVSLRNVIADVNRYSRNNIRIATDEIGNMSVTAAFQTTQIDQMIDGLAAILPITIERLPDGEVLLKPDHSVSEKVNSEM